ncbi:alternative ribosome rescue aminoacyl-tRNA hydrolase ArfB [Phycicoccus duodecadis]|uniref:Ribosome-associated protein n=1 Tax=Phycicoccus duodecadis TaxID=173053 RepID=A0A2N3YKH9_9MICO|nr:alternative ribosome rescue aminoacyl-tRNA hydrolase ArfB [Phycicoccus duodecadis]PKW27363.1 ribosome-associated protein [Phycicoccus duodecadis]
MDLVVPPGPGVPQGLTVPAAELVERFSRSSGPGGQGVNTADSRVELELDVDASVALASLGAARRERLLARLEGRLVDGRLVVAASEHRQQRRNRVAARERMADLLREALAPPPPARRPTRPTRGSKERRLAAKKRRGELKSARSRPPREG